MRSAVFGMMASVLLAIAPAIAEDVDSFDNYEASCEMARSDLLRDLCKEKLPKSRAEFGRALKGDYQAQRNVGYCLFSGSCSEYRPNKIAGCAWRVVTVASGSMKVDAGDISNYELCVRQLSSTQMAVATEQARTLFKHIYRRDLPAPWAN